MACYPAADSANGVKSNQDTCHPRLISPLINEDWKTLSWVQRSLVNHPEDVWFTALTLWLLVAVSWKTCVTKCEQHESDLTGSLILKHENIRFFCRKTAVSNIDHYGAQQADRHTALTYYHLMKLCWLTCKQTVASFTSHKHIIILCYSPSFSSGLVSTS